MFPNYKEWLKTQEAEMRDLKHGAEIIETTLGPVEVNFKDENKQPISLNSPNEKPTLLIVHGGLGGHDQGMNCFHMFFDCAVNLLSFSRPGYCKTPLSSGDSFEAQADLAAAMLEAMRINKVVAIGVSAGGGALYQLALRHPDKINALIAVDAISMKYLMPAQVGTIAQAIFLSDPGTAMMNKLMTTFPKSGVQTMLKQESLLNKAEINKRIEDILNSPEKLQGVLGMFRAMKHYKKLRKAGTDNDMVWAAKMDKLPLHEIKAPSLIIHGTADGDVLFWNGVYAYESIPNAKCHWIEKGSHLGFWTAQGAGIAQAQAKAFLKEYI